MSEKHEALLNPQQALLSGETKGTQAAIYARTSSTSQRFGYSLDEQVRQCVSRCRMLEWDIVYVFRDEAKSGKDTDRPMFQQMLTQAEKGAFDVVVFWKLDRFSRSIMHAVQLEKKFRDWNVALHSVTEQIDTTTAAGRFNFRNIANAAEFERELIKQRTKMGHTALAMEHKWPNSTPPLGYEKASNGRLSVVGGESALVRWIFETYLEECSMPVVAQLLNQRGQTTKDGNSWKSNTVGTILRNKLYAGTYNVGKVREEVPEYQILSQEKFNAVTSTRRRFQTTNPSERPSMSRPRKRSRIQNVLNRYFDFQDRQ
ncbi:Site-specific DNA recombinase [Haloplanus vescus]|uniref:Site-specific DNA recombinase n=1 Tax=Haloplanus vescus TaxID=555874 RepID=A0A1H3WZG3_9EURY|nr:recombinase family protein [Haloplanus vescus]SDZ92575.1 Site-specific DNA recombinase [Haloplanus vescus]